MKLDGVEIAIEKTNRRKTVSIFIERDGSVRVLAPVTATDDTIENAVRAKEYQIFAKLAKWKELNQGKVKKGLCQWPVLSLFRQKLPFVHRGKSGRPLKVDRRLFATG